MFVLEGGDEEVLQLLHARRVGFAALLPPQVGLVADGDLDCGLKRLEHVIEVLLAVNILEDFALEVAIKDPLDVHAVHLELEQQESEHLM